MNNLFIIFTQKSGSPLFIRNLVSDSFSSKKIIAICSDKTNYKLGLDRINRGCIPILLVIYDNYTFSNDNDKIRDLLGTLIPKRDKIYAVYHKGSGNKRDEINRNQQSAITEICKKHEKKLYSAFEHHIGNFPAADALNKIAEALLENNGDEALFDEGLKELREKPNYFDPKLEASIQLWKSLTLLGIKINKDPATEEKYEQEVDEIKGEVPEVAEKLKGFTNYKEFDNDMKNLYDELFPNTT